MMFFSLFFARPFSGCQSPMTQLAHFVSVMPRITGPRHENGAKKGKLRALRGNNGLSPSQTPSKTKFTGAISRRKFLARFGNPYLCARAAVFLSSVAMEPRLDPLPLVPSPDHPLQDPKERVAFRMLKGLSWPKEQVQPSSVRRSSSSPVVPGDMAPLHTH